ncbi:MULTISPECIES: AAA family ATPase [unclassified Lentilitoribacter]|jgi:MoxR-like ATPase|uniref:AAA family ATPase n=1 Tax=unclassified Lentilitoribacter TaxID=2647570 RepID=UPI0013A6A177|nr:MoxR family ATPase [Lentilitoribacter sp. Alg239-R112]
MGKTEKPSSELNDKQIIERADKALVKLAQARREVGEVIFGQESVVERTIVSVLSGGHVLLVGAPGLAKTKLVETLGTVLGLSSNRIQFTPDLMPADILGSEVMDSDKDGKRKFRFISGPIFTQLLMADEINRASPRTQSALLQAMQEHHVTIAGQRHDMPKPFHVLATQNPLEQEGTYPLPEAQLDRFLMQVDVPYPSVEAEQRILMETTGGNEKEPKTILSTQSLSEIQELVRAMPISENVVKAILELVRSARPGHGDKKIDNAVSWGPGPRAGQALMLCARARALYDGRLAPSIDDIAELAHPVLQHRMALSFTARAEGTHIDDIITSLVERIR